MKKEPDSKEIIKFKWLYYDFQVYSPNDNLPEGPCLYVYAAPGPTETSWTAFYIGHTESLVALLPTDKYWQVVWQLGATHVHVRMESQMETRQEIQKELVRYYRPRLNLFPL